MKFLKVVTITLSIFAVLFSGAVAYIVLAEPDILKGNDKPLTTASSLETRNDMNGTVKQNSLEPSPSPTIAPSPTQFNPSQSAAVQSSMPSPKPTEAQPTSAPSTSQDLSTPPSKSASVQSTPAERSTQDPSTLIIGRWKAANNPKAYFEFFQDGTFTRGTYEAKNDYNEFSGRYSFSSSSRLKLQYEKWTIELSKGYKNTRADNTSHVFEITIDDNKLAIPDAKEAFGATEWTKVK